MGKKVLPVFLAGILLVILVSASKALQSKRTTQPSPASVPTFQILSPSAYSSSHKASDKIPEATFLESPEVVSSELPKETPEAKPSAPPKETPEETPSDPPEETPEETPSDPPEETPEETPSDPPEGTPEETPSEPPEETPEETPSEPPEGTPEETSSEPIPPIVDTPSRESLSEAEAYPPEFVDFLEDTVPESDAVPLEWFQNAVFVGDSNTVCLETYASSTGALGNAQFICSKSLGAFTALNPVTEESPHPIYGGQKQKIETAVAACGAKNVYILLGINDMRFPVEQSIGYMRDLIQNIQAASPYVNILVQSVTPMEANSSIVSSNINNTKINQFNEALQRLCAENGWYYLDLASEVTDGDGNFIREYCSDPGMMGIHFSNPGAQVWIDYVRTHVPTELK